MARQRSFAIPSQMEEIPGAEDWREMYPPHLIFSKDNPKLIEYESSRLWFLDSLHAPYPLSPLDCYSHDMFRLTLPQAANRIYLVPAAQGFDHRILNGYLYLSSRAVEDLSEIERRAELFHRRAGHYYMNWPDIFERWSKRMEKIVEDMESVRFEDLPDVEPEETVTEGLGYGSSYTLIKEYNRFWETILLSWNYHFELLNLAYGADAIYIQTVRELFPDITDRMIGQTLAGFDSKLFRPPEELQKLAQKALDSGLADAILSCDRWEKVPDKIGSTEAGQAWLEAFEAARYPWFEMSCGIGWYHHEPTWNQNLDFPLGNIKRYIEALKLGKSITRDREKVINDRDRVVAEYRGLLTDDGARQTFDQLHGIAVTVAPYAEDHMWYCTNYEHAIFFRKMRELGQIFVNHDIIGHEDDIFYFNRYEIPQILHDLCSGWAIGAPANSSYVWPQKISRRKEIMEALREWQAPPALGPAPEIMTEPIATAFFGITTETLDNWLEAKEVKPGETDKLTGYAASSGTCDGIARVCKTIEEISALKVGEILVASTTSPTWAPAFQVIGGCVTDIGGTCCHAAIVAREYDMPAVVGTGFATQAIRTGDKIRVDGNTGAVTILERAAQ
jgi:pyruvate,water dikinase